jgi:hypothetical protein
MLPHVQAQIGMLYLKSAVFDYLQSAPPEGYSNAEIGRALEIYSGHVRHEGHISRTILGMLEAEGLVQQIEQRGKWIITGTRN